MKTIVALTLLLLTANAAGPGTTPNKGETQPGLDVVEGRLIAASSATRSSGGGSRNLVALEAGVPGGLVLEERVCLLLVDGRLLAPLAETAGDSRIRASGILHNEGRALTPFRIEYEVDDEWLVFDLPHSGVSGSGVEGGDE